MKRHIIFYTVLAALVLPACTSKGALEIPCENF